MTLRFDPQRGFGVYVHWPWCAKVCPYCDFNVYAAKGRDAGPMIDAIIADLRGWRARTGPRRVDTVFFGGGTPSLAPPSGVAAILEAIDDLWGLAEGAEITLEANPDDAASFAGFVSAGVNRLSLGVQSLDDAALRFLGRNHDAAAARAAVSRAAELDAAVSVDLIYALPGQTAAAWEAELSKMLGYEPRHVSLYELTIAEGTAFHRAVARKAWRPMGEDDAASFYELTQALMEDAGLPAYEISNHARTSADQAQHNLIYWRSGDWLGVGPGAHGRLTLDGDRFETQAARRPDAYIEAVSTDGVGAQSEALARRAVAEERLIMGLRLAEGIGLEDLTELGETINADARAQYETDGLLTRDPDRLALTPAGRLLADYVSSGLLSA